jgi:hypothetical protein
MRETVPFLELKKVAFAQETATFMGGHPSTFQGREKAAERAMQAYSPT